MKKRTNRKIWLDNRKHSFAKVVSYGTKDVFISVGWGGQVQALVDTSPARARKLAEAILEAVKRETT